MIRPILRDADTRVGFSELFFDLVFVFAITQVSHLLLHHYSLAGALETALIFLAICTPRFTLACYEDIDPA